MKPQYSARTDVGRVREINEDFVFAGEVQPFTETDSSPPHYLLVVADGVGGLDRGEWASETAVAVLSAELPKHLAHREPSEALRCAVQVANEMVWRRESVPAGLSSSPAATTLVAALLNNSQLWWANVGDSRAYLIGPRGIQRLTRDHSWVEEQVRNGSLTPEQARLSARRNVITRGIGVESDVEVDTGGPLALHTDDVVVLCSDGLHGLLSDEDIAAVVSAYPSAEASERLIHMGNARGGTDNISVIVCGFAEATRGTDSPTRSRRPAPGEV